jgi:Zn-dependent peptidase ImmA (M78 family)/transcriptional regulator with XRE-family HTH domain
MITFNPEILVLAREVRALSQEEFADLAGVSQSKVSKVEAGLLIPSDDDLKRFARALDFPVEFFSHSGSRLVPGSTCIYPRKRQSVAAKDLRRLHAQLDYIRIQVQRLLAGVEIDAPKAIYRIDIDELDGDAEHVARIVRQTWGIAPGPVANLTAAIEAAGGIVIKTPFGTDKVDALSQWPRHLPPMFFVNADTPPDRMRFSLAHELGHLVMHAIPTGDIEREADRFAAEFLMPATSILPELTGKVDVQKLAALKPRWKVSMQALAKRAKDLGIVNERQATNLFMTFSKLGWRKKEPVSIPPEFPTVIKSIVEVYLRDKGYSADNLRALAYCTNEDDFASFRNLQLTV